MFHKHTRFLFLNVSLKLCKTINTTGVQKIWDEGSHQTYAYSGTDWYGYETAKSLKEKVRNTNVKVAVVT